MPLGRKLKALVAACGLLCLFPASASACTVATSNVNLGSVPSYGAATTAQQASGSAGLTCNILFAALATHYVGLSVDTTTPQLSGPGGATIGYQAALSPGGAALTAGNFQNLSSSSVAALFSGTNNSVPIYIRTIPKAGLVAGTYTGYMDVRWHYSVCSFGVGICATYFASPGFVRPILFVPINWGPGTPARINITLIIEKDCIINAPDLDFGTAPLVGSFSPVTQTITIRCSAGAAYTVGLDNGDHASGSTRRMASGGNFLSYDIFKGPVSSDRWGAFGAERRSSNSADMNPSVYDSLTAQGFTYRARIDPVQAAAAAGSYSDTVRLDVEF